MSLNPGEALVMTYNVGRSDNWRKMEDSSSDINEQAPRKAEPSTKNPVKAVERVTLGRVEAERISSWIEQLGSASKGFLDLTKSDLVNFLIREHAQELSLKEIKGIRLNHYDPIRHINWIMPRLKEALAKNDSVQVAILQQEIKSIELSVTSHPRGAAAGDGTFTKKSARKKRKIKDTIEDVGVATKATHDADL